jgi:hypothetical protein
MQRPCRALQRHERLRRISERARIPEIDVVHRALGVQELETPPTPTSRSAAQDTDRVCPS